mmetsp:Transcript_26790/g.43090  ORF Transcript_26790/g.43090 Transcript_26790/m.43090 type:complete len:390 (-) Transcript_26790:26-1195(-)|eukprot:CAMPEP_0203764286 /NCGR_PEP_ID=MMETSP0098-20131031/17580_1 /ASSEMBLY_ACC=CAM_ASM_000208 /TAXON_ID=96639 /ORGANISM=" , Strain NY0313808BC1" /LENGTH=389 /DNA_ID=CAMNT_0050660083 /DNA_START=46 /DNA_END=1215 /DNA_ORIENTATION=+
MNDQHEVAKSEDVELENGGKATEEASLPDSHDGSNDGSLKKSEAGGASKGRTKVLYAIIVVLTLTTLGFLAATIYLAVDRNNNSTNEAPATTFSTVSPPVGTNQCSGQKTAFNKLVNLSNVECVVNGIRQAVEQSGANVTEGYKGLINTTAVPITVPYFQVGLCPVNVHWHLGAEHLSVGEFDESGTGPTEIHERRRLAGKTRQGFQCKLYNKDDEKFTKHYNWQHCQDMEVGQTYEVHWPHSAAGACGTLNQYQTPFYDGVLCDFSKLDLATLPQQIGVQSQVFTIVNDEDYYFPDLIRGMIVDGEKGSDIAKYTGSTTGTSRNNQICSRYGPITWQVDRKCHLVSASTFDKMCADMKAQRDDMSEDLHPHGSRELVSDDNAANNLQL